MRMQMQITPIPADFLIRVRERGLDDQLKPVRRMIATGGEPCRDALRRAQPGEEIILASYCPYANNGPYKEFGPIFVFAQPHDTPAARMQLPWQGGDEAGESYMDERFVLRAYSADEDILEGEMVTRTEARAMAEHMLARGDVAFVQGRFPGHGCYAFKLSAV